MSRILLAHGEGGKLTSELIDKSIFPFFSNDILKTLTDSAVIGSVKGDIAFTTDSYTVSPLFFPGGDIGSLSISGTVNDLAMAGAKPLALSFALIIEEGFEVSVLEQIIKSAANTAKNADVLVVAGDTKVLPKGKCDQIFIITAGIGVIAKNRKMDDRLIKEGDLIVVSGPIAKHGATIAAIRHNLKGKELSTDCAPLNKLVEILFENKIKPKSLHDPTRGGIATLLHEVAKKTNLGIELSEESIPISDDVSGVCEILGLDPLYLASEGRFVGFFKENMAEKAVSFLNTTELGKGASVIGRVTAKRSDLFPVVMKTKLGSLRPVDELSSLQLPRIC